jgi:prepilin-type N-terminal cleavage/methylation domain-containing protein
MRSAQIGTPAASPSKRTNGERQSGFTLIEALVALSVVLAFAAALGPFMFQSHRILTQGDGRVRAEAFLHSLLETPFDRANMNRRRDGTCFGLRRMSCGARKRRLLRRHCVSGKSSSMMTAAERRAGFTLVEMLAALAITAMVIMSMGALLYQTTFFFDRGTRTVDQSEQLALAVDSLKRDFAAARFVVQRYPDGIRAAFTGTPGGDDASAKVLFVTAGGKGPGAQGAEAVSMTIERGEDSVQLVRRRSAWAGPHMRLEDVRLGDPVVLLKGKFAISFKFSELTEDGKLEWRDLWTGEHGLPYSVRLTMRDDETGADLLPGADFRIYADAPAGCAGGGTDCVSLDAAPGDAPGAPQTNAPKSTP